MCSIKIGPTQTSSRCFLWDYLWDYLWDSVGIARFLLQVPTPLINGRGVLNKEWADTNFVKVLSPNKSLLVWFWTNRKGTNLHRKSTIFLSAIPSIDVTNISTARPVRWCYAASSFHWYNHLHAPGLDWMCGWWFHNFQKNMNYYLDWNFNVCVLSDLLTVVKSVSHNHWSSTSARNWWMFTHTDLLQFERTCACPGPRTAREHKSTKSQKQKYKNTKILELCKNWVLHNDI